MNWDYWNMDNNFSNAISKFEKYFDISHSIDSRTMSPTIIFTRTENERDMRYEYKVNRIDIADYIPNSNSTVSRMIADMTRIVRELKLDDIGI